MSMNMGMGLAAIFMVACAPSRSVHPGFRNTQGTQVDAGASGNPTPSVAGDLRFQLIYVIHGDAGYTYYDETGERRFADREAVAQAEEVARNSPAAEVFIFHQKPSTFLWFLRGADGMMRHYRGGKLLRTTAYQKETREDDLESEAALFHRHAAFPAPEACPAKSVAHPKGGPARFFLYFGHEIPVTEEVSYSRSHPDMAFSMSSFARGLAKFGGPGCSHAKPFSLIVLSACHGGTPTATSALTPYTSYLLASPGDLHLSYLDTRSLARAARESPVPFETAHAGVWARAIALESFERLRETTSTAITLSLYDTDAASAFLDSRREAWQAQTAPAGMRVMTSAPKQYRDLRPTAPPLYRDCAENPAFGLGGEEAGVTVYYHAPRFGLDKSKLFHSGWECPAAPPQGL
ncbi:MAG: hypothetical protein M3Y08_12290 [Fibrobacterota bacterium]|nr:hypothetical protein [Fibrobacterota bacterium]